MLKRECIVSQGITTCQIPYDTQWISAITSLVALLALLIFSWYAFFKLLTAFFK